MAFQHGKSSVILIDEYNLSAYFRTAELGKSIDVHETTTFGDSAKEYLPGLKDGTLSFEGLWDGSSGAVDERIQAMLGTAAGQVITVAPAGMTIGNRADLLVSRQTSYNVSDPVGDLVIVSVDCQASGGIEGGVVLNSLTAVTGAGNGTAVDGTASTANGFSSILHVISFTGTNATIKAQASATEGGVYSDLTTFTVVTGATKEQKTGTGTVERWTRYNIAGTFTSIVFGLALARR